LETRIRAMPVRAASWFHHVVKECAGQELNLHIPEAAALQAVGLAHAQPTHVKRSSTGGSRTHRRSRRFELRRFSNLRTAPN
jgi:hypothetical protein